jgi:hypothetical protein
VADIVDPTVVAWCNDVVRPVADRMVGLNATIDIEASRWFATISPLLAGNADGDTVIDGSAADGRTTLTKADIVNFVTQMLAYQTQLNGGGVFDVVNKPAVNPGNFTV